jgi:hypothetical protein
MLAIPQCSMELYSGQWIYLLSTAYNIVCIHTMVQQSQDLILVLDIYTLTRALLPRLELLHVSRRKSQSFPQSSIRLAHWCCDSATSAVASQVI